ncbi:MAG TPA: hypothetical protein VHS53_11240 [Mucilaginibacter sp.]|nr:hypothetical protein [Mucilaginibacter sp.]
MKRYLFFFAIMLSACTPSKQQRAEKAIKAYLQKKLKHPDTYESVKFSKLDTAFSTYITDPKYRAYTDSLDHIEVQIESGRISEKRSLKKAKADSAFYQEKIDSVKHHFVKKQNGWLVTHTYRALDQFGALSTHSSLFTLNMACDSITDIQNLTD